MDKQKRTHPAITKWEKEYIKRVNAKLLKMNMTVNQLCSALGSTNHKRFRDYFEDKKGSMTSRTIGRIDEVLKLD